MINKLIQFVHLRKADDALAERNMPLNSLYLFPASF